MFAGSGGLDSRIQSQEVRLAGDLGDYLNDFADLLGAGSDQFHGLSRLADNRTAAFGYPDSFWERLTLPHAWL